MKTILPRLCVLAYVKKRAEIPHEKKMFTLLSVRCDKIGVTRVQDNVTIVNP